MDDLVVNGLHYIGYDAVSFNRDYVGALIEGIRSMDHAQDTSGFLKALEKMEFDLQRVVSLYNPPSSVLKPMEWEKQVLCEKLAAEKPFCYEGEKKRNIRRVSIWLDSAIGNSKVTRLGLEIMDACSLLVNKGGFSLIDAKCVLSHLALIEAKSVHDLISRLPSSKVPMKQEILRMLELHGSQSIRNAAREALCDMLSVSSLANVIPIHSSKVNKHLNRQLR